MGALIPHLLPIYSVNVKDYGAIGDGNADDTAAIDAACAASVAQSKRLLFPAGSYVYTGSGLFGVELSIVGQGRDKTRILLGSGKYFVDNSIQTTGLYVSGIHTVGGAGAIRSTYTGSNVQGLHVVEDCYFQNFTVCAISTNSSDFPFWNITRCTFYSASSAAGAIGIALSGYLNGCEISHCSFNNYTIGIKLCNGGHFTKIIGCDFVRWEAYTSVPRIDVWAVITAASPGVGLHILDNQFSAENLNVADYHIIYAEESAGTLFGDKQPNLGADSTGIIGGHVIRGNTVTGVVSGHGFIYSTTPNIINCIYGPNTVADQIPPWILQIRTPAQGNSDYSLNTIFNWANYAQVSSDPATWGICNAYEYGALVDPLSLLCRPGYPIARPGGADRSWYVQLLTHTALSGWNVINASKTGINDALGISGAQTINITSGGGEFNDYLTGVVNGSPLWIEADLRQSGGSPLAVVEMILALNGYTVKYLQREITIDTTWRRYRFLWTPQNVTSMPKLVFKAMSSNTGTFDIGRVSVYHASEPLPTLIQKRPAVTGDRLGNAALASLITALAAEGLITDSTTDSNPNFLIGE